MASKYPSIPSVPSDVSATTRAWMQAVTQALQSGTGAVRSADRFLKLSDIGRTITLDDDSSNSTLPYSGEATGDTPNPPTNFNVTATIYGSILSWEYPVNNADIVSHVEVWTNSINARSEASRVAIVTRPVAEYKDVWKSPYADHYYWIRCVSYGGKYSTWLPTDAMGGELVMGATSISKRIDDALDILQENLTKDQLATDLLAEINTIAVNTTSIATESSTRSSADSALASSIETVQTSVNNNTASIETANTSIDGIKAEHTVKVQVRSSDGKVVLAGIGMMADSESNQSEIIIMADKFQIVTPDTGEGTPKQPFVVGTVDGVSTIGIDGTLMVDGSVNTKAIATDNAFIGHTIQSANYSAGTAGWQINGATGLAEFNGITFRITDLKSAAGWDELPESGADVTDYEDESIANSAIEIGGRNLVTDSANLQGMFSKIPDYDGTVTYPSDSDALSGIHCEFACTTAGTGFHTDVWPKTDWKIGKTFTWSFYAKCSVAKTGSVGHECGGVTSISLTTEWQKFEHTWVFTDGTYHSFTWYMGWLAGETLYVRDFKIEKGNKATDWTPSPEDIESAYQEYADAQDEVYETTVKAYADGIVTTAEANAIAEAQTKADAAQAAAEATASADATTKANAAAKTATNWAADSDTSVFDGGNIYAGSSIQIGNLDGYSDYCKIDSGDIIFYYYFGGSHREYKSLKRIETGTALNGQSVTIPGYWNSTPHIMISPAILDVYSSNYPNQSQKISCQVENLTENSTGVWSFTPKASLILSSGESSTGIYDATYSNSVTGAVLSNTWTTGTRTTPLNVSSITVNTSYSLYAREGHVHLYQCRIEDGTISITIYVYIDGTQYTLYSYSGTGSSSTNVSKTYNVTAGAHTIYLKAVVYAVGTSATKSGDTGCTVVGNASASFSWVSYSTNISADTVLANGILNWIATGE